MEDKATITSVVLGLVWLSGILVASLAFVAWAWRVFLENIIEIAKLIGA